MTAPIHPAMRPALLLLVVVALGCLPIWAVDYFVPQDGPAHAYTAQLMLDLLRGDAGAEKFVRWNSWLVPNSSGHWLLVLLLQIVSPFTATKILATLTCAGLVAALGFLRFATVGREGLTTTLLLGAALAFNWLWLCGLYNFLIGVIGFAVAIGLLLRWRERLSGPRLVGLALLFLLIYFSHIVAFGLVVAASLLLALDVPRPHRTRRVAAAVVALLPATCLALVHAAGETGTPWSPVWRRLADPGSLASWIFQLRTADPFVLISRRAFPFTDVTSSAFAIFTPALWLLAAFAGLAWGTWSARTQAPASQTPSQTALRTAARSRALAALCAACALAAIFGPDDFGESHGTLLRERLALLAAVCFVPLFRSGEAEGGRRTMRTRWVHLCLVGVVLFQTAALWEYARRSSRDATEFLALADGLAGRESLASVIVLDDGKRFHSNPTMQMSNYFGIVRDIVVWDNYEIGYDLFPLRAQSPEVGRFVRDFTSLNVFDEADPAVAADAKLARLASCLEANRARIDTLLLWGRNPRIEAVLAKGYEVEPFFERGRGRLFRRRAEPGAPVRELPQP